MIDDGVIKFNHNFIKKTQTIPTIEYQELESVRKVLHKLNRIGAYSNGIGFGNLSIKRNYQSHFKTNQKQFLISGTQTGELSELTRVHYTRVVDYDLDKNEIKVIGPIKASSESLTHASIYESSNNINCVLHIHNFKIWNSLLKSTYPKIPKDVEYGTKEMAQFARKIVLGTKKNEFNLFAMEGHEEGVIFFHENLTQCLNNVLEIHKKFVS
jgi:ribulose-5-phosphate 4-epimerase/fuculose-1-phosphate aldolase